MTDIHHKLKSQFIISFFGPVYYSFQIICTEFCVESTGSLLQLLNIFVFKLMFNFIFICKMRISEVVNLVVYVMNGEKYSWQIVVCSPVG